MLLRELLQFSVTTDEGELMEKQNEKTVGALAGTKTALNSEHALKAKWNEFARLVLPLKMKTR